MLEKLFFPIKMLNFKTLDSQWSWRKLYLLKTFSILFFDNSNRILISSGFGSFSSFFFFQTSKPERTAGEAGYHRNKVVSGYSWKLSNFGSLHEARFQSGFNDGVRFALEFVVQLRLIARTLAASSRFYRTIFYRRGEKLGLTMDKRKKFRNNFTNFVRRRDFCRRGWGRGQIENQPAVVGNYFDEKKKKKKNKVDAEERSWSIVLSGVSSLKMPSCRRLYNVARCCVRFVPPLSSGLPRKI